MPAGTAMVIPSRILEEYQSHQFYGQPFNYLIDRYIVIGPSDLQKGESTYYIPLSLKDDNPESKEKITMIDVTNIKHNPKDERLFITIKKTKTLVLLNLDKKIEVSPADKDAQTEASAPCLEGCFQPTNYNANDSLQELIFLMPTIAVKKRQKQFDNMIKHFCNTCKGVDIGDFIDYVRKRSKEEDIPKEILFPIMYKESKGNCDEKNINEKENSIGLFQMNTKNSTGLKQCVNNTSDPEKTTSIELRKACQNGNYRIKTYPCDIKVKQSTDKNIVCLNNPYCNFEEALHLLICKWHSVNKNICKMPIQDKFKIICDQKTTEPYPYDKIWEKQLNTPPRPEKSWKEMTPQERDMWRYVVIAYNGGIYDFPSEENMREKIGLKDDPFIINHLTGWRLKRAYIVALQTEIEENTSEKQTFGMSYMEDILGFDEDINTAKSSLIQQWNQYNTKNMRCSKTNRSNNKKT